jgi:hypothetical protein
MEDFTLEEAQDQVAWRASCHSKSGEARVG